MVNLRNYLNQQTNIIQECLFCVTDYKKEIPIFFSTNNNYVRPLVATINSLIQNSNKGIKYNIHVLYDTLSKLNIDILESLSTPNVRVSCKYIDIRKYYEKDFYTCAHFTQEVYFRILIPLIFPETKKCIYIDCDTIIKTDLKDLYETDLKTNVIASVINPVVHMKDYVKNELNIPYETYFNSGLLLFNCEEYRKHKIAEKCMSFLTNNTQVKFVDQDALNVVCVNKAHFLNMQWNYQWHFELNNDSVPDYCKDQYKKAR
ncbi:MAG: glycosyltransferase family 8 protein [Alphaproteobacteria bacterium]|nr:glycosyltransferase family 8 protein [Alphaproteobacteria bacterium]